MHASQTDTSAEHDAPQLLREWDRAAQRYGRDTSAPFGRITSGMTQANRGGGGSGASARVSARSACGVKCRKGLGGNSPLVPATKVNSNLTSSFSRSRFFSEAFPAL